MIYAVTYGGPTDGLTVSGVRIPRGETRTVELSRALYEALATSPSHTIHLAPAGAPAASLADAGPASPDPDDDPGSTEEEMTDAAA
ncbi:MAG: hypothetical protein RIB67_07485 [Miltoncostaeaceae bacterium]